MALQRCAISITEQDELVTVTHDRAGGCAISVSCISLAAESVART